MVCSDLKLHQAKCDIADAAGGVFVCISDWLRRSSTPSVMLPSPGHTLRQGVDGISCVLIVVFVCETWGVFVRCQTGGGVDAGGKTTYTCLNPAIISSSLPLRRHIKNNFHSQILSSPSPFSFLLYLSRHE